MRSLFLPTNKRARISALRANAMECAKAGFMGFAAVNDEMADCLERDIERKRRAEEKARLKEERGSTPRAGRPRFDRKPSED